MSTAATYFRGLIYEWPKEYWLRANRILKLKRDKWRIKKVIKEADLKHQCDGKRYYVLRDGHGYPIAINSLQIKSLKKSCLMSKQANINNVLEECIYYTGQPKSRKIKFHF